MAISAIAPQSLLRTHEVDPQTPARLVGKIQLRADRAVKLAMEVSHAPDRDCVLVARVNGDTVLTHAMGDETAPNAWATFTVDLAPYQGQEVTVEVRNQANDWAWEYAYWKRLELE